MKSIEINYIEILWEGPFTLGETMQKTNSDDYGLYQIYGDHAIFGNDVLLYIGKAEKQTFAGRFKQHWHWLPYEQANPKIYLGRLGSINNTVKQENWETMINLAERLLIYYCAPPYNSSGITEFGEIESELMILNYGNKMMLPFELSTLYERSDYATDDNQEWKTYEGGE